jgi:pyruvate formate lyase activating enzyme
MNASTKQDSEALLYTRLSGKKLRCLACARRCQIDRGGRGYCRVRLNSNGRLVLGNYGRVVTAHIDTIEKKPVYHYRPGSKLLSIGTVGCNWSCDYCFNACISQADEISGEELSPQDLVRLAKKYGCQGIAYTYNEPLVFLEFASDTGILAHQEGLFNMVVTNGYGTPEAVKALSQFADCVTVGLKANASQGFLRKHSDVLASKPIFRTLVGLKRRTGVHIEISDLVLGQGGDSPSKARTLCRWIHREMGPDTPLHFVRFHPSHQMREAQSTTSSVLETHYHMAAETGLRYVYIANVPGHERENTFCPNCGKMVIGRFGYEIRTWNLDEENRCKGCGYGIPIVGGLTENAPEERYAPVVFPPMDMLYVCEGLSG